MNKRKKVFNGKLIKVFSGDKILPDGRKAYMEEVSHPGASLVVPVLKGGRIVFVRQYRAIIDEYIWELPAGIFSPGEKPVECARRELEEETGYVAGRLKKVGEIYTSPGFCDEKIYVFKTECIGRRPVNRDEHEIMSTRSFTSREVKKLLSNGRITDSKTIAALSLAGVL